MSVDLLHDRIRRFKNPLIVDFGILPDELPPHLLEQEGSFCKAYHRFCRELVEELKDAVAGVRFRFQSFALLGAEGISALQDCLNFAKELGYFVLLDSPQILSAGDGKRVANAVFGEKNYPCDGLLFSAYIGSDAMKPMLSYCKDEDKSIFVLLRSANKSAWELQDLLSGSRHVYSAAAEMVSRHGEQLIAKCGYAKVCGVVGANAADPTRMLRTKHNRMFLLVDGLDESGSNTKNAAAAFDRFGFGAAVNAAACVTAAWKDAEAESTEYLAAARQAVDRIKKNIGRYITIL